MTVTFKDVVVICVYCPVPYPRQSPKYDAWPRIFDRLRGHAKILQSGNLPMYILGDINVCRTNQHASVRTPWWPYQHSLPNAYQEHQESFASFLLDLGLKDSDCDSSPEFTWYPEPT